MKPDTTPALFLTIQPDQDNPGTFGFLLTACSDTTDFRAGDTLMMSFACYPTPGQAEQAAHAVARYLRLTTSRPDDYEEPEGTMLLDVAEYDPDFKILLYPEDARQP